MSSDVDYGKLTKRFVFMDNDHRHAKLLVRLRHDKLTQSAFFRHMITGYIEGDERLQGYLDEVNVKLSKDRKKKSKKLHDKGKKLMKSMGLNEGEVENIFDLIEQEHPDL